MTMVPGLQPAPRGKTAAADVCHLLKQRLLKVSLLFSSLTQTLIVSHPVHINIWRGLQWAITVSQQQIRFSFLSSVCWFSHAAHLCSCGSGWVRQSERVLPVFSSYGSHTPPLLPLLRLSVCLPLSLPLSVEADEGWGWEWGQLEHRELFVWNLFIWLPSSLHTEHIML